MAENNIVFIDVETTGIEADDNFLLEVACVVADTQLNVLDTDGFQTSVYYPELVVGQLFEHTDEYVQNMHTKTGLWDRLSSEGKPLSEVDALLVEYIRQYNPEAQTAWLGGNSIFLDRSYLNRYLPKTAAHIHYRSLDITSHAGPMRWWFGESFEKKSTHRAIDDILESVAEAKFYKETVGKWKAAYDSK